MQAADRESPRGQFGRNVTRLREERNMTQEALAWASGLHQTEIARIETATRNPGLATIFKLAGGLEIPPAKLFAGIE